MTENKRFLLAGILIAFLFLVAPYYLKLIGVAPETDSANVVENNLDDLVLDVVVDNPVFFNQKTINSLPSVAAGVDSLSFYVRTDVLDLTVSNLGGGSLSSLSVRSAQENGYKYKGGFDNNGVFQDSIDVPLVLNDLGCSPCLTINSPDDKAVLSLPFVVLSPDIYNNMSFVLSENDSLVVVMQANHNNNIITKTTTYYGNKYIINHAYSFSSNVSNVDVSWLGGVRGSEKNKLEETTYSQAYLAQNKEIYDFSVSANENNADYLTTPYEGVVDWVAIRNKYFINALVSQDALGGFLGGNSYKMAANFWVPEYTMGLSFNNAKNIAINQFFGPLDVDLIAQSNTYLDRVMNFGWLPIQPFSRSVLWLLKFLHRIGLNYGFILIFFAVLIRVITGPLTKKSFESSSKMQTIQPKIKAIQAKYKNDSGRMNKEIMGLYKEKGVNPLGGCLPMLIQMPLLFSLFIVFRSTIEFRGAPFIFWINNLSQPDTIFYLPFSVPIYGNQVAVLPFFLGISMFLSQRLSMATMDKQQKPMMYMMSVFFFLLFNSFPSGLNLYYVVYNLLNYQQQLKIKKG